MPGVLTAVAMIAAWPAGRAQEKAPAPRSVKINVHYTGTGTVDDKHPILVFLFDSPDFINGQVIPFATQRVTSKSTSTTFSDVSKSPVYVSTVYDPSGAYEGQSAPPSGSSLGMYTTNGKDPGAVNAEPGKTAEIDLSFDDSVKMP